MESLRSRSLFWIVGACLLVGCGGASDRPDLGTVTGTVTLDDKPLGNVWVMFSPTTGRTSVGRTDENGKYELMYLEETKGANLGSHKVAIMTYHEDELEELRAASEEPVKEPIPAKFNSQTTLTADVKEGPNVIDFPLKSAP
jgi:hypothetical protein